MVGLRSTRLEHAVDLLDQSREVVDVLCGRVHLESTTRQQQSRRSEPMTSDMTTPSKWWSGKGSSRADPTTYSTLLTPSSWWSKPQQPTRSGHRSHAGPEGSGSDLGVPPGRLDGARGDIEPDHAVAVSGHRLGRQPACSPYGAVQHHTSALRVGGV
mgnify:CR=1 FL=1